MDTFSGRRRAALRLWRASRIFSVDLAGRHAQLLLLPTATATIAGGGTTTTDTMYATVIFVIAVIAVLAAVTIRYLL